MVGARTEAELRRRALQALAELVPADVLTWDRVELATGAVRHEAVPAEAEPPGAFEAVVGRAADHPLLAAHAARRRPALRLSELVEPGSLTHSELYGDLLHASGVEYEIAIGMRTGRGEAVVAGLGRTEREFSERDRDVLDIAGPGLESALRATQARGRLVCALAADPPPGTAVLLLDRDGEIERSSVDAEALAGRALRRGRASRLAARAGRRVARAAAAPAAGQRPRRPAPHRPPAARAIRTRCCSRRQVASFRPDALDRLGLTARETEVLRAATVIEDEAELAWELFLSLHAVRERLARLEAKLGVRTAGDAVARALRESA